MQKKPGAYAPGFGRKLIPAAWPRGIQITKIQFAISTTATPAASVR
jgi:hypothetical protein